MVKNCKYCGLLKLIAVSIVTIVSNFIDSTSLYSQSRSVNQITIQSSHSKTGKISYLLYQPSGFNKTLKYPVLVYLHSSAVAGQTLESLKKEGIPKLIAEGRDFPFIVIAPQLPTSMSNYWPMDFINDVVREIKKSESIDHDRIYFTGLGKGANAALQYAAEFTSNVSCLILISDWTVPRNVCAVTSVPVWLFHGTKDEVVPVSFARNLTNTLKHCGADVRLVEFENSGHSCWREAYSYPDLFDWMMSKSKDNNDANAVQRQTIGKNTFAYKLPKALNNISGVIRDKKGEFYGINQRENAPVIINFDSLGKVKRLIRVDNASNMDWQDMTISEAGEVFIADAGNVEFNRKTIVIYQFPIEQLKNDRITAKRMELDMIPSQLSFTSIYSVDNKLYLVGQSQATTELSIQQISIVNEKPFVENTFKIKISKMQRITSACWHPTSQSLILLSADKIAIFKGFNYLNDQQSPVIIDLPYNSRKEAMILLDESHIAYFDQYFTGIKDGNFYIMNLPSN